QSPTGAPRVVIIEINSLPALTPATCLFHQAAEIGIRPMDLIDRIIELGFEQHRSEQLNLAVVPEALPAIETGLLEKQPEINC
ncbi:MAG TPA: hypothetical protein VJJ83_03500, partial [Candidatus Babeliales bacterium]|nr:hypothetical protein [Candidatus Babeliales bacterium]